MKTSFYVQLEPVFSSYVRSSDGEHPLREVRATRITQKRPTKPMSGSVTIKLTIDIPEEAFYPLRPEATVTIPADLTAVTPIEVEAEQPDV